MDFSGNNYCFDIFERLDIGILILHLPTKKILSINKYAQDLIDATDWKQLLAVVEAMELEIAQKRKYRSKVRIGQMVIGYTISLLSKIN